MLKERPLPSQGIRALPRKSWVDHYHLTLHLYSIKAKGEGFSGNVESMERCCQEVLKQIEDNGKPFEDRFDVYRAWIDSLSNRGELDKAVELLLTILRKFNCQFPGRNALAIPFKVVADLIKVKSSLKSLDVSTLSPMRDKTKEQLVEFMERLAMIMLLTAVCRLSFSGFGNGVTSMCIANNLRQLLPKWGSL